MWSFLRLSTILPSDQVAALAMLLDFDRILSLASSQNLSPENLDANNLKALWSKFIEEVPFLGEEFSKAITLKDLKAERALQNLSPHLYWALKARRDTLEIEKVQEREIKEFPDLNSRVANVLNQLSDNDQSLYFPLVTLDENGAKAILDTQDLKIGDEKAFYERVLAQALEALKIFHEKGYPLEYLLSTFESLFSFVPFIKGRESSLSFFEHQKLCAALAQDYALSYEASVLKEKNQEAKNLEKESQLILYSMDFSGIQNFIYTITSKGALKGLRARSFYLELLMEHIIDELLARLKLSRAVLLYSGGGHCYLLLPNLPDIKEIISAHRQELNHWLIANFDIALYMAGGQAKTSIEVLADLKEGSYKELFISVSQNLALSKSKRYTSEEIQLLNHNESDIRECKICHRKVKDGGNLCALCKALELFSAHIVNDDFFVVLNATKLHHEQALPLPFGKILVGADEKEALEYLRSGFYVRSYTKNRFYAQDFTATKLWIGDFRDKLLLEDYVESSEGINRLGIFRADVDNLGATFAKGPARKGYSTLAHTMALSKSLSLFFKFYINVLLEQGKTQIFKDETAQATYHLTIVYSGGDDLFLLGAWSDVVNAMLDLQEAFCKFSGGNLTLSGGLGLYRHNFPINVMAFETENLVEASKAQPQKNSITLLSEDFTFSWQEFREKVVFDYYSFINDYLQSQAQALQGQILGKAFLYRLLDLVSNSQEKINKARFVYFISRLEPPPTASIEQKALYEKFSKRLYDLYLSPKEHRKLIMAIYLYLYSHRGNGSDKSWGE